MRRVAWLVLLVLGLAGCGGSTSAGTVVRVSPSSSLLDQPVRIRVDGLAPSESVSLQLRSTDGYGVVWLASATFAADAHGIVDPARSPALAGDYQGVQAMGLMWSMRAQAPDPAGAYFWRGPRRFSLSVVARGKTLATTTFIRRFSAVPLDKTRENVGQAGFDGEFVTPAGAHHREAVLTFGGSEGGIHSLLEAGLLASHGYPALTIGYFAAPQLPPTLQDIPLEYFTRALRWLGHQPQVNPRRIIVMGVSRGSEAALLLGAYFPQLVRAVIAHSPSNVALCSPHCTGPAWTLHGRALPYTRQFDNPHPTDNPAAVIPVERIQAPIFLDCGGTDPVWDACDYAHAIVSRLVAHHDRYQHELVAYPNAGHAIESAIPYEPSYGFGLGAPSPSAQENAAADLWPRLFAFLAAVGKSNP